MNVPGVTYAHVTSRLTAAKDLDWKVEHAAPLKASQVNDHIGPIL